jgi:hypothetical protein
MMIIMDKDCTCELMSVLYVDLISSKTSSSVTTWALLLAYIFWKEILSRHKARTSETWWALCPPPISSCSDILPLMCFLSTACTQRSPTPLNVYAVQVSHLLPQLRNHVMYIAVCFIILATHFLKSFTCLRQTTSAVHRLCVWLRTSQSRF